MDPMWIELRSSPKLYLSAVRMTVGELVEKLLRTLSSNEEKTSVTFLNILGIFQEMADFLFSDHKRLNEALTTLKNIFVQHRLVGNPLTLSQILCTYTSLLIQMEAALESHDYLKDFINLLFDVIEKIKSESNHLLKMVACECLRELEMNYPGLLMVKVGHFYGMSLAENSCIHQSYLGLFATTLEHTVKDLVGRQKDTRDVHVHTDLLSYAEPLKPYFLPDSFNTPGAVLSQPSSTSVAQSDLGLDFQEVKKGVSYVLEHSHLMTPCYLVQVSQKLMACVQSSGLSPMIFKSLFLHYSSSMDIQLFHLVLLLKSVFNQDICDSDTEENKLKGRVQVLATHPSLSEYSHLLTIQWLLDFPTSQLVNSSTDGQKEDATVRSLEPYALLPTVFDVPALISFKSKIFSLTTTWDGISLRDFLISLMKQVDYGIPGPPVVNLFRSLFTYITSGHQNTSEGDISQIILNVITSHPKFIPHAIDFISSINEVLPQSSIPLNLMAEFLQFLNSTNLDVVLANLHYHLVFLKHASSCPAINPLVILQVIKMMLMERSLCEEGDWEVGNAVLSICSMLLTAHSSNSGIFKDLANLLQVISQEYQDLDIRDRARFYHQLLLTVSIEKLSPMLLSASDTNSGGSKLSEIVQARISNHSYPSQPSVQTVSETFLHLSRLKQPCQGVYASRDEPEWDKDSLKVYFENLKNNRKSHCAVTLNFKIHFEDRPAHVSKKIFAIVLSFTTAAPYHPCETVHIPHLTAQESFAASSSKVFSVVFYPKEPIPATFNVSAVFATEDGVTCYTHLPPVEVLFEDLMHPAPEFAGVSPENLFWHLWKYIGDKQAPLGSSEGAECAVSAVNLKHDESSNDIIFKFLVPKRAEEKDDDYQKLLIFLPPRNHVLMRWTRDHVAIATDNWRLLPLVQSHLNTFTFES